MLRIISVYYYYFFLLIIIINVMKKMIQKNTVVYRNINNNDYLLQFKYFFIVIINNNILFCCILVVCCSRRSSDKNYLYNTSHIQVTMFMTSLKCRIYERSRSTQVRIHVSKSLGHNFFTRILRSFVLYKNSYGCCFIKYKGCA